MGGPGEVNDGLGLEIVAAVGLLDDWAHLDILAAVVGQPIDEILDLVAGLEADGLLHGASPLRVSPALTPPDGVAGLTPARRAVLNSRIAHELRVRGASDAVLCRYLVQAPGSASGENVAVLRRHARALARLGAHAEAIAILRRALREPPPPTSIADILVELADELTADGRSTEGLAVAQQARDMFVPGDEPRLSAVKGMFRALQEADRVEEAIRLISVEVESLPVGHDGVALQLECELVRHAGHDARILQASLERFSRRVVDDTMPEAADYLLAVTQILAVGSQACATEVVALVERTIALGVLDGDDIEPTLRSAWLLIRADAKDVARLILRRRRETIPPDLTAPELDAFDGLIALRTGSVSEAVELLTNGLACAVEHENTFAQHANLAFLAHALHEADEVTRLGDLLAAEDLDCSMRNAWTAIVRIARARHSLDQGRPADALADLTVVDEQKVRLGLTNPAGFDQAEYAVEALIGLGRRDDALALAERNLGQALHWGAPETVARGHRALAKCSPPSRATSQLRAAARRLGDDRCRLVAAQISLDLGEVLIAANRRAEAEAELRESLDIATRIGARRIARRATEALATIGRRVRRPHARGVEALTPAELRIATLAASRQSNKEIAGTLHLSVRTVENTLRHAYRKLETNRAGLAGSIGLRGS